MEVSYIVHVLQKSPERQICACLVTRSCPTLCDPIDCSPPGFSVHEDSPGKNTGVGCHALLQGIFPTQELNQGPLPYQLSYQKESEVAQLCPTLCDPMDCSLQGSSIHKIFQVRILEWVVISFSRDLPNLGIEPRSSTLQTDTLPSEPPGKSLNYQGKKLPGKGR